MSEVKFGTGGFRGVIADNFNKDNIQKICQAVANIIKKENLKKHICIGYDNRFLSEQFGYWCAQVFVGNNINVELFKNACSTPVVMYKTMQQKNDFGIMITASHNPYVYNGIKIFTTDGKDASIEATNKIEKQFKKVKKVFIADDEKCEQNIKYVDYVEEFVDYIIKNQDIGDCSKLKVVFDCKHGSTAEEIELLCKKLNISNYKILNAKRDAFFNFTPPAPSQDNVAELVTNVTLFHADIGFALDADGDRLAVVDTNGNYLDNNTILSLVYYYFVKYENKTGDVVKNCATTALLDTLAKKFGQVCHEVPVGFKHISSNLISTNSVVGGESSGGLAIQNHIWGKDSLISIALCLKIISKLNKPFDKIVDEMLLFADNYSKVMKDKQYKYSQEKEKQIKDLLFKKMLLPELNKSFDKIVRQDYLKVFYQNGDWVLIRFSGTEPVLRIFVECDSNIECQQEISLWQDFLKL